MSTSPSRARRRKERRAAVKESRRLIKDAREQGQRWKTPGEWPPWLSRMVEEDEARTPPGRMPLTVIKPKAGGPEDVFVVTRLSTLSRYLKIAVAADEGAEG